VARILVVDDEPDIALGLRLDLQDEGYEVEVVSDGHAAVRRAREAAWDLVLLDVMLPGKDGFEVCRELRRAGVRAPVLMLTARVQEAEKVMGLDMGADDYVTKPFSPREVVARVRAILRRAEARADHAEATTVEVGDGIVVDFGRREVRRRDDVVALATREFDLLAHLARNQGLALSRQQLLDAVWGPDWYGDERTVDVHVRQLRKKLGDDLPLATVWGVGYRLG
jgi:two-component system alkaline phosphatase synthesis response regulator PhoP